MSRLNICLSKKQKGKKEKTSQGFKSWGKSHLFCNQKPFQSQSKEGFQIVFASPNMRLCHALLNISMNDSTVVSLCMLVL